MQNYLSEALRWETRVENVIFLYRDASKKRENGNEIEPYSTRDLTLDTFPLPRTSLRAFVES